MRLSDESLKDSRKWAEAGYKLPQYDRAEMIRKTKAAPDWIHFGAGNIFKAFQAVVVQNLLNEGVREKGIIAAEGFDYEIIEKISKKQDDLHIAVTLKSDGSVQKEVIGSIAESLVLDWEQREQIERLKEIFRNPSLQMASFTITEKGYNLRDGDGQWILSVGADLTSGPVNPVSYIGKVAALLYERYLAGAYPIAMVSMDNCSHNGDKLYHAVAAFAEKWNANGLVEAAFETYVKEQVSYPWSMIDKITPRPDKKVLDILKQDGIEGAEPVITAKNTYVAPFVNAEECQYLVIEDVFPNGRPVLEKGGILFTDGETVDKVEKMKVCTCLNPIHTALAVFGCLLGYELISEEMKSPLLKKMAERLGYAEGLPVVVDPGILNPQQFIDEVLNIRIPNPFMPDTPQRIATDTSQKLAIRFGETINAYQKQGKDLNTLLVIPLVFAGWLRYLKGLDDNGQDMALSPDPILEDAAPLGQKQIEELLANPDIWGVDLQETGLADRVRKYYEEMQQGSGAVARTLKKYLQPEV